MPSFSQPLYERRANAAVKARRYRNDPAWRLKRINRARLAQGLPPRASLDDVGAGQPLRDAKGRFARVPMEPAH